MLLNISILGKFYNYNSMTILKKVTLKFEKLLWQGNAKVSLRLKHKKLNHKCFQSVEYPSD